MALQIILWYALITGVGWLTFPLLYRLLPGLTDRGWAAARTAGLLLWSYLLWLLASLHLLPNTAGGGLAALALLGLLSWWVGLRGRGGELRAWLQAQRGLILTVEALFLAAFVGWALIRALMPEAVGTEKPMELAFINAILRSPSFPPHDPWLSGYAISYYYFGYVMVAAMAQLTGVPGAAAFNLGSALIFALSAVGAYGLLLNLLSVRGDGRRAPGKLPLGAAMFGPLFLLLVSNLEGFLDVLHRRGLFWNQGGPIWTSGFWQWLDLVDLNQPPALPLAWIPDRIWWWWRASRVLQDYTISGAPLEIIDEFPFFSFLLGDLHPHVLALPFALLAVTLAWNLYRGGAVGALKGLRVQLNLRTVIWGAVLALGLGLASLSAGGRGSLRLGLLGLMLFTLGWVLLVRFSEAIGRYGARILVRRDLETVAIGSIPAISGASFWLLAVTLGGMAFLNLWDLPAYGLLTVAAYGLWRWQAVERPSQAIGEALWLGAALAAAALALYLPFYLGFSSQAGGIIPNLVFPVRGAHLWIMFGALFVPLGALLIGRLRVQAPDRHTWGRGFGWALALTVGLWLLSLAFGAVIALLPVGAEALAGLGAGSTAEVFQVALQRRRLHFGGWATLTALLGLALSGLLAAYRRPAATARRAYPFVLLLIALGTLLVLGPEFFFLRDQFGWRMNTIFKFYYQAWLLWSIAAAYGFVWVWERRRGGWGKLAQAALIVTLSLSLVYPVIGLASKSNGFQNPAGLTLDSTRFWRDQQPDEMTAIDWLRAAPAGTVAEAVAANGGQYSDYGRVAVFSGQPNVLGWMGHESQWRGGYTEMGSRQADIARLYCSDSWEEAQAFVSAYHIRYVFVGSLERSTYTPEFSNCAQGLNEAKFSRFLTPVFQQGEVAIYAAPPQEAR